MVNKSEIEDKADELDKLLTEAIQDGDWQTNFKARLWSARKNNLETMRLLDM